MDCAFKPNDLNDAHQIMNEVCAHFNRQTRFHLQQCAKRNSIPVVDYDVYAIVMAFKRCEEKSRARQKNASQPAQLHGAKGRAHILLREN